MKKTLRSVGLTAARPAAAAEPSVAAEAREVGELWGTALEFRNKLAFNNDLDSITAALIETPALFAHWATKKVVASSKLTKLEEERKALEGRLYTEYQTMPTGLKAPTVETIKSMVRADARVEALATTIRDQQLRYDLYVVATQSFQMRLTAIAEVAHLFRSELGAGMKARRTMSEAEEATIQDVIET